MARHALKCQHCSRFVARGTTAHAACVTRAVALGEVRAPEPMGRIPASRGAVGRGHLSRREGMAVFVPEYYLYARRAFWTFVMLVCALVACR